MTFLYAAYTIYCHGRWGQTVGKMIAGIRVLRASGDAIAWREAFLRSVALGTLMLLLMLAGMLAS